MLDLSNLKISRGSSRWGKIGVTSHCYVFIGSRRIRSLDGNSSRAPAQGRGNRAGGKGAGGAPRPQWGPHTLQPWREPTRALPGRAGDTYTAARALPLPPRASWCTLCGLRAPTRHLSHRLCPPEGSTGHERAPPARVGGTAVPQGPPTSLQGLRCVKKGPETQSTREIPYRCQRPVNIEGSQGPPSKKPLRGPWAVPLRMGPIGPLGSYGAHRTPRVVPPPSPTLGGKRPLVPP